MADKQVEYIGSGSIALVPDDILLYLSKNFLKDKDCLNLSLSGVSERFIVLYNRQIIKISRNYALTPASWTKHFKLMKQQISPVVITIFDASHCYWLPAVEVLRHTIVQLKNLRELNIQDTNLGLTHFPVIFKSCQKIVRLSFTLTEKNLDRYKRNDAIMSQGFGRLTELKIFAYSLDETSCIEFWIVVLAVLKWGRDCKELLLEIPYSLSNEDSESIADRRCFVDQRIRKVIRVIRNDLQPHLGWMRSLTSLVILRHREDTEELIDHPILEQLLGWLFEEKNNSLWHSLTKLWVEDYSLRRPTQNEINGGPPMKSLLLPKQSDIELLRNEVRFKHLQHLGGIDDSVLFQRFNHLPNLKYIRGTTRDAQGFNQFCEEHPLLEYLHVKVWPNFQNNGLTVKNMFDGPWQLLLLKVLVFKVVDHFKVDTDVLTRMMIACPNIHELHLMGFLTEHQTSLFFSKIQLQDLNMLNLHYIELSEPVLPLICATKCPKIERLHLRGKFEPHQIISLVDQENQCETNPASHLRDLRLEFVDLGSDYAFDTSQVLVLLRDLIKTSPHLERLVLIANRPCSQRNGQNATQLEDFLITFVSKMENLVALCLVGFEMDTTVLEGVKKRLNQEIVSQRPSLWIHIGPKLPNATDSSEPRIHYDEIVNPFDPYFAPPRL